MNNSNNDELLAYKLRELFQKFGYVRYKMSKFEEYALYADNKDFLVSDSIITFNDTNGKLLALKPDVTLSIAKNFQNPDELQKFYYDESVYRVSGSTHTYKEIRQIGLECMGKADLYHTCEAVMLAIRSLETISSNYVLDLSHIGIVSAIINENESAKRSASDILRCFGQKNAHELKSVCASAGTDKKTVDTLLMLLSVSGTPEKALPLLEELINTDEMRTAFIELKAVCDAAKAVNCDRINIDFSVVNDMNYYSGIVFKSFIDGVPYSVLSGGQYDGLMEKMGKSAKAIGFAVYLDMLERLGYTEKEYDADTVLLYSETDDPAEVLKTATRLSESDKSVSALSQLPEALRAKEIIYFKDAEAEK